MRAREREQAAAADDGASIMSDGERRFAASSSRPGSFVRDARAGHGAGQHSLDAARLGYPRPNAPPLSDMLEGQECFEKASPIHIDSVSTFWSPFQPDMSPR